MQRWQMQDAKARMSEVVKKAQQQPQDITVHGRSVAVVVSRETYDRLTRAQDSLVDFMRRSPLQGAEDIEGQVEPSRQQVLLDWLETELPAYFNGRILPIDAAVADRWSRLVGNAKRPLPAIDSLLAATAMAHGLVLVTRNVKDFAGLPVDVFNPWGP